VKAIILAGGSGQRFWPLSTAETPKQFLPLFSKRSLLRNTFDRLNQRIPTKDIAIVTGHSQISRTQNEIPELPKSMILGEPEQKNTAPAVLFGMLPFASDDLVGVFPADHLIIDIDAFWTTMDFALRVVTAYDGLFTFGMIPSRPETGYGYIKTGQRIQPGAFKVDKFVEKPSLEEATTMTNTDGFFWNGGMFLFPKKTFLREMQKHCPEVFDPISQLHSPRLELIKPIYQRIPSISIDYALMERSDSVYMIESGFPWSDVGSWDSIAELEDKQKIKTDQTLIESHNVYIRDETNTPTTIIGVNDAIVVHTKEGLLICKKGLAQRVKERFIKKG